MKEMTHDLVAIGWCTWIRNNIVFHFYWHDGKGTVLFLINWFWHSNEILKNKNKVFEKIYLRKITRFDVCACVNGIRMCAIERNSKEQTHHKTCVCVSVAIVLIKLWCRTQRLNAIHSLNFQHALRYLFTFSDRLY